MHVKRKQTLKWAATEESFIDLEVSSGKDGKIPERKEHLDFRSIE